MVNPARLLIVDDHRMFTESLARSLSDHPEFHIVGCASTLREAEEVLSAQPVDLVILDYELHSERGSALVAWAGENRFEGLFFILTAGISDADALWLIQHDVSGVFLKDRPLAELVEALKCVA